MYTSRGLTVGAVSGCVSRTAEYSCTKLIVSNSTERQSRERERHIKHMQKDAQMVDAQSSLRGFPMNYSNASLIIAGNL